MNDIKTVTTVSGENGLVFAAMAIGTNWLVAVRKYGALNTYVVIDTVTCDDEQDARITAWEFAGYK